MPNKLKGPQPQQGFLKISRKLFSHPFWDKRRTYSDAEAWIDLLQMARFDDTEGSFYTGSIIVKFKRGELVASVRFLAERWRWGTSKLFRFIELLVAEKMVKKRVENGITILAIINYARFNDLPANPRGNAAHEKGLKNGTPKRNTKQSGETHASTGFKPNHETPNGTQFGTIVEQERNNTKKDKESKEEREGPHQSFVNAFNPPDPEKVRECFWQLKEPGDGAALMNEMAKAFYEAYDAIGWIKKGSPVKNFKSLIPSFIRNWKKFETNQHATPAGGSRHVDKNRFV